MHHLDPSKCKMLRMLLTDPFTLALSTLFTWVSTIQPAFEEACIWENADFDLEEALALDLEIEAALATEANLQAGRRIWLMTKSAQTLTSGSHLMWEYYICLEIHITGGLQGEFWTSTMKDTPVKQMIKKQSTNATSGCKTAFQGK
jgi:hypothetical protein